MFKVSRIRSVILPVAVALGVGVLPAVASADTLAQPLCPQSTGIANMPVLAPQAQLVVPNQCAASGQL